MHPQNATLTARGHPFMTTQIMSECLDDRKTPASFRLNLFVITLWPCISKAVRRWAMHKKTPPMVSRRVSYFHNPVWDYILTLHFKGCSPLSHAQKNTPHGFPEGVLFS